MYLNLYCAVPFVVSLSNHERIFSHDRGVRRVRSIFNKELFTLRPQRS
jgi:hypothetical protein